MIRMILLQGHGVLLSCCLLFNHLIRSGFVRATESLPSMQYGGGSNDKVN